MRAPRAKVVSEENVTRAKFLDGTKLLLEVDESQPSVAARWRRVRLPAVLAMAQAAGTT